MVQIITKNIKIVMYNRKCKIILQETVIFHGHGRTWVRIQYPNLGQNLGLWPKFRAFPIHIQFLEIQDKKMTEFRADLFQKSARIWDSPTNFLALGLRHE